MADDLHRLLSRQIRKAAADRSTPPQPEAWTKLLDDISRSYASNDADRALLERSLELTSQEMQELYARIADERDRLQRELEIAMVLQTSLLPQSDSHPLFDISAKMIPASEVGGDYYDIISTGDHCWFGIGDVAGHGLRPAMIMLMLQSIVAAMVRADPTVSPSAVLAAVNRALWDNIRKRLHTDEHVTCSLLDCSTTGKVRYAGAHEDILVVRVNGRVEQIETPGAWLAAVPEVATMNVDRQLTLSPGDMLVLFTDGITEAMNAAREQFGLERVISAVQRMRKDDVTAITDEVLGEAKEFMERQADDLTLVVARFR